MKKKKESSINTNNNNGITITDSISLSFNSKYRINSKLLLILTALAGVTGFTLSLLTLFDFPCFLRDIYVSLQSKDTACSGIYDTHLRNIPVNV